MKRLVIFLMAILLTASCFVGCGNKEKETEKPYEPLIRENLMWDTDTLFERQVTITDGDAGDYTNKNGQTKAIFYDGAQYKGKDTTCFAYIGYPSTPMPEGGYPAIVLVHGGGGCSFYEWVEYWNGKGYVAIAPDFYAQQYGSFAKQNGLAQKNPNGGPTDSGSFNNTAKTCYDSWIYHSVYNIISANNILRADERVNKDKIGITGISWGSVLTAITSGVDYRFAAFSVVYGSGFLLETPGVAGKDYFTMPKDSAEWMDYYDPSSYLAYCNRPILFTIGTNDHFFSPLAQSLSANLCQGEVYYNFRYELRHYHRWKDEEGMIHVADFMDHVLNGKEVPFFVKKQSVEERTITCEVTDSSKIKQVRLVYTDSIEGMSPDWKWSFKLASPLDFEGDKITIDVPESAKLCFVEFSDKEFNEYFASTDIFQF